MRAKSKGHRKTEWRAIKADVLGGLYEVSNDGQVRSWNGPGGWPRKTPLVLSLHHKGSALTVRCASNLVSYTYGVARLVLEAFVGPPPDETFIARHRDRDPENNRVENLYWGAWWSGDEWVQRSGKTVVLSGTQVADARRRSTEGERHVDIAASLGIGPHRVGAVSRAVHGLTHPAADGPVTESPGRCLSGEDHPRAVLDEPTVRLARQWASAGFTVKAIADRLGRSVSGVASVVNGATWRDVDPEGPVAEMPPPRAFVRARGECAGMAKLDSSRVRAIRGRAARGERHCDIARDFGVTQATVRAVVTRTTWRHVEEA